MLQYQYVAQRSNGQIERGQIGGSTPSDVQQQLARTGRRLVGIEEAQSRHALRDTWLSFLQRNRLKFRFVRSSDIELMLQQLAVMLGSGLELTPSLRELSTLSVTKGWS